MPKLSCPSCGRELDPVSPFVAAEGRCPRCGGSLKDERREVLLRMATRRTSPPDDRGSTEPGADSPSVKPPTDSNDPVGRRDR